jgi:acetoin utilization protein AcuC
LARALGWLTPDNTIQSTIATEAEALRFHDVDYLACLQRAERDQTVTPEEARRFGLGIEGNGLYPDVYRRPMTAVGGTLLACRLALERSAAAHHPGGGTHHARAARASGFCYLNDAVVGLLAWLDSGLDRIVYLDIDAHHGDGVEAAFHDDPRVLTISIHEQNRWPRTGLAGDRAGGAARNLPVPPGLNDTEMRRLIDAVMDLIAGFAPQALMLQCGADALDEDPQSRLSLSNNAHLDVTRRLLSLGLPLVVLGGGGYNPWTVARTWAGVWAVLSGQDIPCDLPEPASDVLRQVDWHLARRRPPAPHLFLTLRDMPREGPVRDEVQALARQTLEVKAA